MPSADYFHEFVPDPTGTADDCAKCPLPRAHPRHVVPTLPETPYAGTSGWSGSDTSRERAEHADADGTTSERQARTLAVLAAAGERGATWRELADREGWHHGQASGTLSVLHKRDRISRLTERRDRCLVYVLPECVAGRETTEQGRRRVSGLTPDEEQALEDVEVDVEDGFTPPLGHTAIIAAALRRLAT